MGALDRKERVNCVWTKVVPFLFQASLLIPNDLFMFFCDLFISCIADSMHRKKKKKKTSLIQTVLRTRCFSRPGSYWCIVNKPFVGRATFCSRSTVHSKRTTMCFFMLPFVRHYVHLFFFCFFFFFVPYLALLRVQLSTKILSHQNFTSQYKKKTPCPESDTYCRNCKYGRFSYNYQELPTSFLVAA